MFGCVSMRSNIARVPVQRHHLVGVGEVSIVAIGPDRHACRHCRVELRRVEAPLLPRVVAEELLVQLAPDFADDHVLRRADVRARLRDRSEELVELKRREVHAVQLIDRIEIDRNRQQLSVDAGKHPMLIRTPGGELRQVVVDVARIRVEDVRPVLVYEQARFVVVIVGVAADVRPAIADEHLLARVGGEPLGNRCAGEPCADNQVIEHGTLPDEWVNRRRPRRTARRRRRGRLR